MKRIEIKKLGDSQGRKPPKFIEVYFGGFLHSRKGGSDLINPDIFEVTNYIF